MGVAEWIRDQCLPLVAMICHHRIPKVVGTFFEGNQFTYLGVMSRPFLHRCNGKVTNKSLPLPDPNWWYTYPSEKWWSESQLGWWNSQLNGNKCSKPPSRKKLCEIFQRDFETSDTIRHWDGMVTDPIFWWFFSHPELDQPGSEFGVSWASHPTSQAGTIGSSKWRDTRSIDGGMAPWSISEVSG